MHARDDDYLTVNEAATLLRVAPGTVRRWIREGEVPAYHLGPRRVALRRADVARLVTPVRPSLGLAENGPSAARAAADQVAEEATPEDRQQQAAMTVLDAPRREDAVRREQTEVRRLTDEEVRQGLEAMERAQQLSKEILARRGGKLFSPSWQIIEEMRDERLRELTGE